MPKTTKAPKMTGTYENREWLLYNLKALEEEHEQQKQFYQTKKAIFEKFLAKLPRDQ